MSTSLSLALHRVVPRHGETVEDSGWLLRRMMEAQMERIPRLLRHGYGRFRFTRLGKWWEEAAARKSQAREYPGDWVYQCFDGDGETFDFGVDNTECGNVKHLHAQDADELCPYICDLEYVVAKGVGVAVHRTKAVAWSCDRCDFRFSKHGVTSVPWPPEFTERTCGEPQA
ncbi:MAG: L-2-amino-thiazoline-4-carboxylic acid hydrolase [Jiangellales bacterium]